MLLRWFVLLRMPIAVLLLGGFVGALSAWGDAVTLALGSLFVVGLYVFLAVASIRLVRRRPGALSWAGLLLTLEVVGAVLIVAAGPTAGRGLGNVVSWACTVLLLWALPNALALYKARGLFVEQTKKKPGL